MAPHVRCVTTLSDRGCLHSNPLFPQSSPVLAYLERLVDPFPDDAPQPLPNRLLPFLWQCTKGARRYIAAMTAFTALIGAFEAWLFAAMSRILDWLAGLSPAVTSPAPTH